MLAISVLLVCVKDCEGSTACTRMQEVVFFPLNFMEGEVNWRKAEYILKPMINLNYNTCSAMCL